MTKKKVELDRININKSTRHKEKQAGRKWSITSGTTKGSQPYSITLQKVETFTT
jgi:hypothetical protein